jgi:hypothetical protein
MPPASIFQRLPGESGPAFQAFRSYRELGSARSTRRVAQELGKSKALVQRWSSRWRWQERIHAWEDEQDRRRESDLRAVEEMARRHATIACAAQERVVERLAALTADDLAAMSFGELVKAFATAVRVEREARGLPNRVVKSCTKIELSGGEDDPRPVEVIETVVRTAAGVSEALRRAREEGVAVLVPGEG